MDGTANIVVLCADDRCIAPAVAVELLGALQTRGLTGVTVTSAGTRAVEGQAWCLESRHHTHRDALSSRVHSATQVTQDMIRTADLVLTSERRLRGAARLLDPHSAARTFTLVEAATLGRAALEGASGRDGGSTSDEPTAKGLSWFVEEMDALRGIVPEPGVQRAWWARGARGGVQGFDLLDPHAPNGSHKRTMAAVRDAVEVVADCVARSVLHLAPV
jgi:protein-tyrosine phosphatase